MIRPAIPLVVGVYKSKSDLLILSQITLIHKELASGCQVICKRGTKHRHMCSLT